MITLVSHPINPSPQHFPTFPLCSPLSSFHLLFTCPSFAHSSLTLLVPSASPLSLPPSQAQHGSSCQKKPKFLLTNPDSAQPSSGSYLAASTNKGCNPLGEEKSTWQGKGLHGEVTFELRRPERMGSRMKIYFPNGGTLRVKLVSVNWPAVDVNWDNPGQNGTYGQATEDLAAKLMRGESLQRARRRGEVWLREHKGCLRIQGSAKAGNWSVRAQVRSHAATCNVAINWEWEGVSEKLKISVP